MTQTPHPPQDSPRALSDHLRELRLRLLYALMASLLAAGAAYPLSDSILDWLSDPLLELMRDEKLLVYTGVAEAFVLRLKLSFYMGLLIAFPVLAYQMGAFLSPGLYRREKLAMMVILIASPVLFSMGAGMAYFLVFPLALQFFLGFETQTLQLLPRASEYLSLILQLMMAFGLCFQLPVVLSLLAAAKVVRLGDLKKFRRYWIVVAFTLAAVLTPPDLVSQIMLAVPLLLLYEFSILLVKITREPQESSHA